MALQVGSTGGGLKQLGVVRERCVLGTGACMAVWADEVVCLAAPS